MAVPSTSPSRSTKPQSPKSKLMKNQPSKSASKIKAGDQPSDAVPKRTKSPGVRLVGGRIYDSENGKTCHQCRQKTMDFTAACNNLKKGKQCTIRYCHKCLFNRYGEKAEEKASLDDWKCPKCRDKCNCSFCMKKKGQRPTGILTHTAKATGFSSVSEMLDVMGPQSKVKRVSASPKKGITHKKETALKKLCQENEGALPRKDVKDTSSNGIDELQSHTCSSADDLNSTKPRKRKHSHSKEMSEQNTNDDSNVEKSVPVATSSHGKKLKNTEQASILDQNVAPAKSSKRKGLKHKIRNKEKTVEVVGSAKKNAAERVTVHTEDIDSESNSQHVNSKNMMNKEVEADLILPTGIESISIAGTELPSSDVGQALQFLEFCSAFGKVFNLRKGQAEAIVREIVGGCERRRAQYSAAIQFHMELISLIEKDSGEKCSEMSPTMGKNSWLHAAMKCISNSKFQHALSNFSISSEGYNALDSSRKLMLLNFLCDEALDTEKCRSYIEEEYSKSLEQEKQGREKVTAAKEKERVAKGKMQDELAKAIIAKSGAPLTISEHENIVSKIKIEAAEARAQLLEARGFLPNKEPRSDAVRTEPLFVDSDGNTFWKLKGFSDEGILLQEIMEADGIVQKDHWFTYAVEQMSTLEKYISFRKQVKWKAGN
ncbi:hypothetical protein QQ045_009086 [Rhodiola kirilowii]